jgi:hypothetical protein
VIRRGKSPRAGRSSSRVRFDLVLPVAGFGSLLLVISAATGKLQAFVLWLPLPEPALNGWPLLCAGVLSAGLWRALRRVPTDRAEVQQLLELFDDLPPSEVDELRQWALRRREPLRAATWPDLDPNEVRPTVLPVDVPAAWS